jgi:ferredoxin--NADP+ reductase
MAIEAELKASLMLSESTPAFAIVGSGPSGCYTAQFLRKAFPESPITVFDRNPVPFGLVRYGVAPDHIGTKAISSQFERLFDRDGVKFVGATEIGVNISLDELRRNLDAVVLATGLSKDRPLNIPGGYLPGVYGSGRITRLLNGHPEENLEGIRIGERLVVVGHGNVAIDLVRLSLLGSEKLAEFGVETEVAKTIARPNLKEIHVVGRSPVGDAKFDVAMINELGKIPDVRFSSNGVEKFGDNTEANKRAEAISKLVRESNPDAARVVTFHFGWAPSRVGGDERVEFIEFTSTNGLGTLSIETDTIFSAIGFVADEQSAICREDLITDQSDLVNGYLSEGLYCVGWFKRGPQGAIPANRVDAKLVSDRIIQDLRISANMKER